MHPEQLKITQKMILEYKGNRDAQIFEDILVRIDDSILGMVYTLIRKYYFNQPNIQDLYQCAISGLYKAIDAVSEKDDYNYLLRKIYTYVRKEVFQQYGEKVRFKNIDPDKFDDKSSYFPLDENIVQEERIHFLSSLLPSGFLNKSRPEDHTCQMFLTQIQRIRVL